MRWQRRTLASWGIRGLTFILPVAAGISAAAVSSMALPPATSLAQAGLHWALLLCISLAVVLLADAACRQLLPLATLLELSLLFPGDAPSRFRVALRAGNTRSLERKLSQAREDGDTDLAHYAGLVLALVTSISEHDRKTRGHSERVRAYADLIAEELGLTRGERDRLRWAALLHDVGKLEVPGAVLNKDGSPDDREWRIIREHPAAGARIAGPLLPWLGPWSGTIAQHHERFDGGGYPRGLEGDEICLGARIVAVADAYETMTSVRSYKEPVSPAVARAELAACAGSQFDAQVVRAFMNVSVADLRHIMAPITVLFDVPIVRSLAGIAEPVASGVTTAAAVTAISVAGTAGTASGDGKPAELPDLARSDVTVRQEPARDAAFELPEDVSRFGGPGHAEPSPAPDDDPAGPAQRPGTDAEPDPQTPTPRPAATGTNGGEVAQGEDGGADATSGARTAGSTGVTTSSGDRGVDTPDVAEGLSTKQPQEPRDKASPNTGDPPVVRPPSVHGPDPDDGPAPDPPDGGPPPGVPPQDPPPSAPPPVDPPVATPPADVPEPPTDVPKPPADPPGGPELPGPQADTGA